MDDRPEGLEAALAQAQSDAEAALKAAATVVRELKRARASALTGQIRDLTKALATANEAVEQLAGVVYEAAADFDLDATEHLQSGAYTKELLAAAAAAGLAMFEEDGRLLSYPSLVRLVAGDAAIEIDRRRERRIRPSVVVELLAKAQQAGSRFKAEPFLESLAAAYELVLARQGKADAAVVKLLDVYAVLTLLPGQARDYSKQEFARDLYLLDLDGHATTKSDRRLRWSASTGTRQAGVLTTVARSGQKQRYWGIAFS